MIKDTQKKKTKEKEERKSQFKGKLADNLKLGDDTEFPDTQRDLNVKQANAILSSIYEDDLLYIQPHP